MNCVYPALPAIPIFRPFVAPSIPVIPDHKEPVYLPPSTPPSTPSTPLLQQPTIENESPEEFTKRKQKTISSAPKLHTPRHFHQGTNATMLRSKMRAYYTQDGEGMQILRRATKAVSKIDVMNYIGDRNFLMSSRGGDHLLDPATDEMLVRREIALDRLLNPSCHWCNSTHNSQRKPLKLCSKCYLVFYCSHDCHISDWLKGQHDKQCCNPLLPLKQMRD